MEVDPDGDGGYRVVGYWRPPVGHALAGKNRPFMVDLDHDGMLNWKLVMDGSYNSTLWPDAVSGSQAFRIARHPDPAEDVYVVTGHREQDPGAGMGTGSSAFLLYFDGNGQQIDWWKDSRINNAEFGLSTSSVCNSNRVAFATTGGNASIIWPVLTDFSGPWFSAYNHQATAKVYHLDLAGDAIWTTPADLGSMRGFDLQLSCTQRSNGNIAIACTKSIQSGTPLTWVQLSTDVQDCLENEFGYGTVDWETAGLGQWGHWLSDSYLAELDVTDGSIVWDGTWDADVVAGNPAPECVPDNITQRQCSFQVVEADDAGLVVCGNTGNNWEDGFLVKFHGCESDPALYETFHAMYPYDPGNVYTITTNTTWNSSMNVRGSIVVPAGITLTINSGAVIRFADSRKVGFTTNIVVEVGGKLAMTGGSHLTSMTDCDDSMWDGVMVLGNPSAGQATHQQGVVDMSNSTISNAITAIYAGNGDIWNPFASSTQNGGIIRMTNMTFTNNIYGIVHRPYTVTANGSRVRECTFQTSGPLNYGDEVPQNHITVISRWKLDIEGSTFRNTSNLFPDDPQNWGVGIHGHNSNIWVFPFESTPCSFERLSCGLLRENVASGRSARVLESHFEDCARGVLLRGLNVPWILENTFEVPDLDVSGLGIASAYGIFLEETTGFDFQENTFTGPGNGADHPNVGAIFVDIGEDYNEYYNNTFDGFTDAGGNSAGTIIMGTNDGPGSGDGLVIKCNDYSNNSDNDFDVAFTGEGVTIGDRQGNDLTAQSPAGNTFASDCNGEQHFFNPEEDIATFTYFHHDPNSTAAQIVPECATDPPIIVSGGGSWYESTSFQYTKENACPTSSFMMLSMEDLLAASESQGEMWAESTSVEEAAHHHALMAKSLYRLTELALSDSVEANMDLAIATHEDMPVASSSRSLFGLHLAKGDTTQALQIAAEALEEDPGSVYWNLVKDYVELLQAEEDPYSGVVSAGTLETIANSNNRGRSVAIAWLAGMGIRIPEYFILPGVSSKRSTQVLDEVPAFASEPWGLDVFPNPSEGLVQFRVVQPEEVTDTRLHVYDISGQVVAGSRLNVEGTTTLSLQLAPGVYVAALESGGLRQKQCKFMVIR